MAFTNLNLFFAGYPDTDFISDVSFIKDFREGEIFKIIDSIIELFPKDDVENDWNALMKDLSEEEIKKRKAIMKAFLFIFKELASEKISESELRDDFECLAIPSNYLQYAIEKLNSIQEFKIKASKTKRPYDNVLRYIEWRIDSRNYNDGSKEDVAIIEFLYSLNGEKEILQLDFSHKRLLHFISLLNKIELKLCQTRKV